MLDRIRGNQGLERRLARVARRVVEYPRGQKRMIVLALDVVLCLLSSFAAFSLRVGALDFPAEPFLLFATAATLLFIPIFYWAGAYSAIFRFSGVGTIRDIGRGVAVYTAILIGLFMINSFPGIPRTVAVIHPIIFFGLTSFSRITMRQLLTELGGDLATGRLIRRAVIYGAGSAGLQLALSLRHASEIALVGFVDDDARLAGHRLEGLRVHDSEALDDVIQRYAIDTVLLALPNVGRQRRREIIERLEELSVQVQTLPQIEQIVNGRVSVDDLREVQIEDLLGRDPVEPDEALLRRTIAGKTVLVTGAGGSIGSELCRQIADLGPARLVLVEITEHALYEIEAELRERTDRRGVPLPLEAELLNLVDAKAVRRVFERWKPDTVFHAAAYKHVPLVEKNVISGLRNNILGTRHAALAAEAVGVQRFILISTDKAVRPTNVMGASKRVCEQVLQALDIAGSNTRFAMVRFGNVLGSSGSVVPRFKQQIRDGGPVTLTHRDITRYFMTIPEAAQLVIQAGAMAEGGEVYLLDMGEPIRVYELAEALIRLSGLTVRDERDPDGDIEIVEVGLRPGEKLYEELLIGSEAEATGHSRIWRGRESALDRDKLDALLARLIEALDRGDSEGAVVQLRRLVPEYSSKERSPVAEVA